MQQPYIQNKDEIIANILLFQENSEVNIEAKKKLLYELWNKRLKTIEDTENRNQ